MPHSSTTLYSDWFLLLSHVTILLTLMDQIKCHLLTVSRKVNYVELSVFDTMHSGQLNNSK